MRSVRDQKIGLTNIERVSIISSYAPFCGNSHFTVPSLEFRFTFDAPKPRKERRITERDDKGRRVSLRWGYNLFPNEPKCGRIQRENSYLDSATMATLAEKITRTSSFQTYITIKLLVDKSLVEDCFRAYAYLRWLDDQVDVHYKIRERCLDFIKRQKRIINDSYLNIPLSDLLPEEKMVVELIATNRDKNSKLGSFILNFFKIIEFDAYRKNTQITQKELDWYSGTVSIAVTDGIEYFINHKLAYPERSNHYLASKGAHLVHMLRDYQEDLDEGFTNIPKEYLCQHQLEPNDIYAPAFRNWVKKQVLLARKSFYEGKKYIKRLPVVRSKIAALWYCARFEGLLDTIQKDGYILRSHYPKQRNLLNSIRMFGIAVQVVVFHIFLVIYLKVINGVKSEPLLH